MSNTERGSLSARIARGLLEIGAFRFSADEPFKWSSGMLSPVYCDNRLTISFPELRSEISDGFVALLEQEDVRPDVVVGTATAGIPHAAWLAERLGLPMAYVRHRPKEHGSHRQVEGRLAAGDVVVVVEDLVSTGGSSLRVLDILREEGAEADVVMSIVSYDLPLAAHKFERAGARLLRLVGFDDILAAAIEGGEVSGEDAEEIRRWHDDPTVWMKEVAG